MNAIELTNLHKTFHTHNGDVHAVRGLSLAIPAGQTTALLGPNGAGKSTTIDMLLGLTTPDSGRVEILGATPRDAVNKGAIGAMLQSGDLIQELTIREIVDMVACLYPHPRPVAEALELAGLTSRADRKADRLSGGEAQRVRFAIAIVSNPQIVVLDEPTVAMDVESREAFWDTMDSLKRNGVTILFATHYLEEADQHADRVVVVAHGQTIADGEPREIKRLAGGRRITASVPGDDAGFYASLPGVDKATLKDGRIELACTDSDMALKALVGAVPGVNDIEVRSMGLDEAFLSLTRQDIDMAEGVPA